jgi:peptidoglycan hydrolase CwlO-like protein
MVKYSKKYNHLIYIFQIISEMQAKIDNQEGEMRKLRDLLKERDTQIEVLKSTLTLERSRLPHRHNSA